MGALELSLVAAAVVVGLTGTWSPCGFSMIETIGPTGHTGGKPTTLAACVTFLLGSVAGGVFTFAALATLGALVHGAGGRVALLAAAALALAVAVAEARGTRIAPQVRRQLPEHWRRLMPMPIAAGLYGILLGLGFTTFVLTFGVWALAGISFAVGEPGTGLLIGLAFGIGRAVPVIALAPVADRPAGARCTEAMATRPSLYRGARLGDAVALAVAAAVLVAAEPAGAQRGEASDAADPSAQGEQFAFQEIPDRSGVLVRNDGQRLELPGNEPEIGGGHAAVMRGGAIVLMELSSLDELDSVQTRGTDAIAVSERWLVYRTRLNQRDRLVRRKIRGNGTIGQAKVVHKVGKGSQLGQPDLDGNLLVYAVAKRRVNRIMRNRLGSSARGVVLASRTVGLSNPSVLKRRVLYVRSTSQRHQLRLKRIGAKGSGRSGLLARKLGAATLWSTALSPQRAYVTILKGNGNPPRSRLVSVSR